MGPVNLSPCQLEPIRDHFITGNSRPETIPLPSRYLCRRSPMRRREWRPSSSPKKYLEVSLLYNRENLHFECFHTPWGIKALKSSKIENSIRCESEAVNQSIHKKLTRVVYEDHSRTTPLRGHRKGRVMRHWQTSMDWEIKTPTTKWNTWVKRLHRFFSTIESQ